jgi:hypothetical protein
VIGKDVADTHDFHGLAVWVCNSKAHEELVMFLPTDKHGEDVNDCPTCGANVLESYEIFPLYLSDKDPTN